MKVNSRIRFNPGTKEIEIEGSETFVKAYFAKLQGMMSGAPANKVAVKKECLPVSMTKIDIVESVHEKIGIPQKDCVRIVESVVDIIKSGFENGNHVNISGFGKWSVSAKMKSRGRNPQTGDSLMIDARKVVTFKPSMVLRDRINS